MATSPRGASTKRWGFSYLSPILVVEDDATMRMALRGLLLDEGIANLGAESVEDARRCLATTSVSGVICDFLLRDGTADVLLDVMVGAQVPPPVILASVHPESRAIAKHYGVGFMRKPYDLDVVLASVRVMLEGNSRPVASRRKKPVVKIL